MTKKKIAAGFSFPPIGKLSVPKCAEEGEEEMPSSSGTRASRRRRVSLLGVFQCSGRQQLNADLSASFAGNCQSWVDAFKI